MCWTTSTYSAATTETTYTYKWVSAIPEPPPDEDKVDKADLDPIVRIYQRIVVRRSELEWVYFI